MPVPGPYTVRLTVNGKTRTSPMHIVPDSRGSLPAAQLDAQLAFALRVRDDISKLTGLVNSVRSVREQLQARTKALEPRRGEKAIADLLAASDRVVKKADALEDKLHNPTAEVVYDILAMRGGTRLYSRLAPLLMWATESDGPPTEGMTQVLEGQEKELQDLERETQAFVSQDVSPLNATAAKLGLGFVVIR